MVDLIITLDTYNNNFSNYGWMAYLLINVQFMKDANKIYDEQGIEKIEKFIANY